MPLLGTAAVAMWWDIAAAQRAEFEDWHSHEHFRERLRIPGFLRGSRWASASGDDGFFVLYELAAYETLTSRDYLARLNDPTPWSVKMMPHHRNMVRSQCRIVESHGGGVAQSIVTLRLSPQDGRRDALHANVCDVLRALPSRAGVTGAHLLRTDTPNIAGTREQAIRGGADAVADWILLVSGYDEQALAGLVSLQFDAAAAIALGARPEAITGFYTLSYTLRPDEL